MTKFSGNRRVAYLFGAGGSHACVKTLDSSAGILMSDLSTDLAAGTKELVKSHEQYQQLLDTVNQVVGQEVDFEHLITFFDESPSAVHKAFADGLRNIFERVLNSRLQKIKDEYGPKRANLYSALFDMYNVNCLDESLHGVMTLNYDDYIEVAAAEIYNDGGVDLDFSASPDNGHRTLFLKLHGSFAWEDTWPIRRREPDSGSRPLWIPPGIRKAKERYPFNLLWGLARDVLNCDVLRVIGCKLGPSDWDLISLLFGTRHANWVRELPYSIEVIDSPEHAFQLQQSYPYLNVKSLFEIDTLDVGKNLVGEYMSIAPCRYDDLSESQTKLLQEIAKNKQENWFHSWLVQMAEGLQATYGEESTDTHKGAFRRWLEI